MTPPELAPALAVTALVVALATGCATTHAPPVFDPTDQVQPVTSVLRSYEAALNRADLAAIASLYAPDAVFMAQHRSPAVGRPQIETAYREIFETIQLDIAFEIDEVSIVSPTVAVARTRSAGTTTIVADGAKVSEGNQELFVLVRADADSRWQIGRYIFSTTQPRG